MNLDEARAVLTRTPEILRAWLADLPAAWLETAEGEGTFCPRDVLGHLIHGEQTDWMPRVRIIMASGDARPFERFDRHGYRGAPDATVGELLREFAALRAASLAELRRFGLTQDHMTSKGLHPDLGPVTLGQLLATWTVHDLNHLGQIARVMSRRYTEAVGPWREYLGILRL